MKSDNAVSPAGISRRTLPPYPPTPHVRHATSNAPTHTLPLPDRARPAANKISAPPWGNRRYLTPSIFPAYAKSWTRPIPVMRDANLFALAFVLIALGALWYLFLAGRERVTIQLNEQETTIWTRQQTVRDALIEAGISWKAEDIVRPGLNEALPQDGRITLRLAMPIVISADGDVLERRTQATTISQVLKESNIRLKPQDLVFLDGRLTRSDASLPRYAANAGEPALFTPSNGIVHLTITRALPITINDNGTISTLYTTENTLGTALAHAGVQIYVGDSVTPDLTTPVTTGAAVYIRRSRPASVTVDGRTIRTRTRADTVAKLLAQEGVKLEDKDYAIPAPNNPLVDNLNVNITRVREVFITETEELRPGTYSVPNPNLELDEHVDAQAGAKGEKKRLFKSVYENGKLISTGLEREWIEKPPQDHIINYGTKVVVRELTLPDGSVVQYWRKIRLLATAYSAATSGKDKEHPEYGRTRLGLQAGRGIVAVDPRLINLGSSVYVPGYGQALAGDTGGRIKGKRIDLGFPEDAMEDWYRWVDVYVLTPVPPPSQFTADLSKYDSSPDRKSNR